MDFHCLLQDAAQWGWMLALLVRATERLERWLGIRIYRVNVRQLRDAIEPVPLPKGLTAVRPLTESELVEAAQDSELELDPDFIRQALGHGDLACGAYEDSKLVGYTWRAPAVAPFRDGLWVRIGHPLHYVYKSFTRPSHRGKGIHIALTRVADRHMLAAGRTAEAGFIDISNMASLRAARSLGRHKVGYAGYIRLFGHCFTFRTAGVRATGAEFYVPTKAAPEKTKLPQGGSLGPSHSSLPA